MKDYTMYPPRVQLKITQIARSDMPFDYPLKVSGINNSKLSFNIFLNPCKRLQFDVTDTPSTSHSSSSYSSSFSSQVSTSSLFSQGSPPEHRTSSQEDGSYIFVIIFNLMFIVIATLLRWACRSNIKIVTKGVSLTWSSIGSTCFMVNNFINIKNK